jgi:thiamine pyrophosphate-dependent acetolactate synthase large subunit-like protein
MIKVKMVEGDVCLLGKAHGVTAYNMVFGIEMEDALAHSEFASLGSALPFALGVAKMRPGSMVYVVCGDGEMQEGSCHEALLAMVRLGIENVEVHVDGNGMQAMGDVPRVGFPVVYYHKTVKGSHWTCHYASA